MSLATIPFDPLFDVVVALLKSSIEKHVTEGRGALARAVRVLSILCREGRDLARKDPSVAFLMAYCASLFDTGPTGHYCDGLPEGVDPMVISQSVGPIQRGDILQMEDTLQARCIMAKEIDDRTDAQEDLNEPISAAIPLNLPAKVKLFAMELGRFHARFRANTQYPRFFKPCQRKGCARPSMIPVAEQCAPVSNGATGNAAAINERRYWQICHTGSTTGVDERLPVNMSFCSTACFCAAREEYDRCFDLMAQLPAVATFGPPPARRGQQEITASRLYRAALARNASIGRSIKFRVDFTMSKHYPVTLDGARAMQKAFVDAINVDLGMLYAAAVICELPPRLKPNAAMPKTADWRSHPWLFTNPIRKVRAIYKASKAHDGIAKGSEPWLSKVKAMSLEVFS